MFVLIDLENGDNYSFFGDTLESVIDEWKDVMGSSPAIFDTDAVMIIEGVQKIPQVTYVNAPVKKQTEKTKSKK